MKGTGKDRCQPCAQGPGQVKRLRGHQSWSPGPTGPCGASAAATLSCSSVDGRVRRYDLRMGQLFSDYVGSECGWCWGAGREGGDSPGDPSLTCLPSPPPRPHHLHLLQPGWPVHPGVQPRLHLAASGQGHRGAAGRVSPQSRGAPPPPPVKPAPTPTLTPLTPRYTGHKNKEYKLDCCLSERDTHVVSCSEDGKVFFWDLVEVSLPTPTPRRGACPVLP